MDNLFYPLFGIFFIGYLADKGYKKIKQRKAKKIFSFAEAYIDEYFFDIKKGYENYQLTLKYHSYDLLNESVTIKKGKKYLKCNIDEAIDIIKRKTFGYTYSSFFSDNFSLLADMYYDDLIKYFGTPNSKLKLQFINDRVIEFATELTISEFESQNIKLSKGAEYIALYTFNQRTLYHNYPDSTYIHLKDELREIKEMMSDI